MRIDGTDAARLFERAAEKQAVPENTVQKITPAEVNEPREENKNTQVSETILSGAIGKANKAMAAANLALEFSVHKKTKEIIVKVVDTITKEVVREIPSEKILDMVASMLEMVGILVDERR